MFVFKATTTDDGSLRTDGSEPESTTIFDHAELLKKKPAFDLGVGGEFGEGALLVRGKTAAYHNLAAASIGLQAAAQVRSQLVLFMTEDALKKFRNSEGWKAGVDGSVALATSRRPAAFAAAIRCSTHAAPSARSTHSASDSQSRAGYDA